MNRWIGIAPSSTLQGDDQVRLFSKRNSGSDALDIPAKNDRIVLVPGVSASCRVVEAAANHVIIECKGEQLLAVPSDDSGKEEQEWVVAAVRKVEE